MAAFFSKYWPLVLTIVGAIAPALSPAVAGFWAAHPSIASGILLAWGTVKFLLPSPLNK